MNFFTYILYSSGIDRYYIGETDSLETRLEQHLSAYYKGSFSVQTKDWAFVWVAATNTREDARKIEAYIKNMKSKKFIQKLIFDIDFKNQFPTYIFNKFQISLKQIM